MKYDSRNGYMLSGSLLRKGYDWWWHSFVAQNKTTRKLEPFFIEYYIINPGAGGNQTPVLGQLSENQNRGIKPSYAMIKAGKWGENKAQIHNFYPLKSVTADRKKMDVKIGDNIANDTVIKGMVQVSEKDAKSHSEYMCDAGTMSWDLKVHSKTPYSVGYGTSWLFRKLNLFEMYWHIHGMKTVLSGTILYNGIEYTVEPDTSYGYQDKNWGIDYTNPWIWLNCNNFKTSKGDQLQDTSLVIGGGNPKVLGVGLGKKILVAFRNQGKLYEFNFTKFLFQKQQWKCHIDQTHVYWDVEVANRKNILEVHFKCPLSTMILVNYENPDGKKMHNKLFNGGYASGEVILYEKKNGKKRQTGTFTGELGGCEFGEY